MQLGGAVGLCMEVLIGIGGAAAAVAAV